MSHQLKPEADLIDLRESCRTLILATLDPSGTPQASSAAFIYTSQDGYYVFVSALSPHTAYLTTGRRVGILLIEDEGGAQELLARRRLNQACSVSEINANSPTWSTIMHAFERRFGSIIDVLQKLPDFRLFRLTPESGRFIRGFGQAYRVVGEALEFIGPDNTNAQ